MQQAAPHLPAFIQVLEPVIRQYGYLGVGALIMLEDFGVPAPGETVLIAAAFFAGLGDLNIFLVAAVGFAGAVLGDNIGFAIGKYGGHPLVERFGKYVWLTPKRITAAEAFFRRHGGKVVVVARFFEGLRQLNGIIAGLSEMPWPKFLIFNALGAALWVGLWSAAGYFGGDYVQQLVRYQLYLSVAAALLIIGYIVAKLTKRK